MSVIEGHRSLGYDQMKQNLLLVREDVYGDSIDKILQGNTGNIVYIKSTDDSMLEILQGLSGQMHRLENDSETVSTDMYKVINTTDGKLSKNRTVKEVPVISKNDMLRVPKGNIMVFGKGNPIWSRNQLAMPYSFMSVHSNALKDFDDPKEYTLRTVPTTANTMDFDILNNQPNFIEMVSKRVAQAKLTSRKLDLYKQNHKSNGHMLTDDDLSRIDPEALARELMRSVNQQLAFADQVGEASAEDSTPIDDDEFMTPSEIAGRMDATAEDNTEVAQAQAEQEAKVAAVDKSVYAHGNISKHDLLFDVSDDMRQVLGAAYVQLLPEFKSSGDFKVDDHDNLIVGGTIMIKNARDVMDDAKDDFGEDSLDALMAGSSDDESAFNVEVQPEWLKYLASLPNWQGILQGQYDDAVGTAWDNL